MLGRGLAVSSKVVSLALPITVGVLADAILSLVSLAVVSTLSTEAVAAVGVSSYLFFLINAALMVFSGGVMVIASQAIGAGRYEVASKAASEALGASLAFSLLLTLSSPLWLEGYLTAMTQGDSKVARLGCGYAAARLVSLPALAANVLLSAVYRSADRPWPAAASSVVAAVTGSALIPLFALNPLGWGVVGAGVASALASYAGLMVYAFARPPVPLGVSPPGKHAGKVVAVGLPVALERIVASVAQNIYLNAVARGGARALAAHNIGITVENLVIQPTFALSMAALITSGRSVGADDPGSASTIVRESVKAGALWMGLAALLLSAASPYVGWLFTSDPEVARLSMLYLLLAAASEVGLGISQAYFGAIRGMGSVWLPFIISAFTVIALRALPAQLLSLRYGAVGAWLTQNTDMYGRALLAYAVWKALGTRKLAKKLV